jgi:type IV pilus assembly protein PilB
MKAPLLEEKQRLTTAGTFADRGIPGLSDLYFPEESDADRDDQPWFVAPGSRDIVDVLVETGKLSAAQRNKVRQGVLANPGRTIEELLPKWQMVGPEDVLEAKARLYGIELRRIRPQDVDGNAFEMLDIDFIRNNGIIPVSVDEDVLVVGTSEPENVFVLQEVRRQTQMELEVLVCSRNDVLNACEYLEKHKPREKPVHPVEPPDPPVIEEPDYGIEDIISDIRVITASSVEYPCEVAEPAGPSSADRPAEQPPVVQFVNYIIANAMADGTADIRIDRNGRSVKVNFRIDGVLTENNGIAAVAGTLEAIETYGQSRNIPPAASTDKNA